MSSTLSSEIRIHNETKSRSMKKYISNLILAAGILGLSAVYAADDQSSDASSTPTIVLEERYKEIQEERKALKKVMRDLSPIIVVIKSAEGNIKKKELSKSDVENSITLIKSAITKLKSLPAGTEIERGNPVWEEFARSYQRFSEISSIDTESELSELQAYLPNDRFGEQIRSRTDADRVLSRIIARIRTNDASNSNEEHKALSLLYDQVGFRNEIKKVDIEVHITNAQTYLSAISETTIIASFESSKNQILQTLTSLALELRKEIESREALNKRLLEELGEINQQLETKRTKQTIIDQGLIFAVYGMIGVLLLMFLSLRIFHSDVALELIKRRALIEVVGMAFMLITIIILGTGGKINTETLGTLLGTIAGYIFGRIGADRDVGVNASNTNNPNNHIQPTPKSGVEVAPL
jgi:hypothetical protein